MDPITHGFLGSTIAQSFTPRSLGLRLIVVGGLVAMLPDIDIIADPFVGTLEGLFYHRWITHSIFFGPIVGPLLGFILWKIYGKKHSHERKPFYFFTWSLILSFALLSHAFLDCSTSYGTQLFSPFSTTRIAWDAVAVIDPFYSIIVFIAVVSGIVAIKRKKISLARRLALSALILSTLYLGYGYWMNQKSIALAKADPSMSTFEIYSYPTLLQPHFHRLIAMKENQSCIAYFNILHPPQKINWSCQNQASDPEVKSLENTHQGQIFIWFAMGKVLRKTTRLENGDKLVKILDLRYGLDEKREMWGIEGLFDQTGTLKGQIKHYHNRLPLEWSYVKTTLKRLFL